jgi:HSP20 family molecular chaperone IbpA
MSVIQAIWDPPAAGAQPTSSHPQQTHLHMHHFHFPPKGLRDATASFNKHLKSQGRKLSHIADGGRGAAGRGSVSSWSPNTDIRQTRLAYHIEIEVPGTTDKEALLIQWLSPCTLLVRGEIERPFVGHGKAAEGAYQWQQSEESGDRYSIGNVSQKRAQDDTNGHDVSGGGQTLHSTRGRGSSLKENEHDGRHVPSGFTSQSSTGSKQLDSKTADDSGELQKKVTDPGDECADIPMFLLEERSTGPWQRMFTLPHDVEMKALKARLEGGLLRIDIPIRNVSEKPATKVEIE